LRRHTEKPQAFGIVLSRCHAIQLTRFVQIQIDFESTDLIHGTFCFSTKVDAKESVSDESNSQANHTSQESAQTEFGLAQSTALL
jgi:hypothetical protein